MDCFKSGRDCAPGVLTPVVLAGRGGAAGSPKKSKPSKESLVLVDRGGAGSAFGATLEAAGAALRVENGSSPPIRSP